MHHVLLLTDALGLMGGAERNLCILADQFRARQYKVFIACLKGGTVSDQLEENGFSVRILNVDRIYGPNGIKEISRLISFVRRKKISVVLTYHESSDIIGALITVFTGIPVVSSRRDLGFNLKKQHLLFYKIINPLFAAITTVSAAVKDAVIETQRVDQSRITVIYNGVDPKFTLQPPENHKFPCTISNRINLCCVANIRPIKGHKYLLHAIELIQKHNQNFCLYLLGRFEEDDECYRELRDIIRSRQLEDYVVFSGAVPAHEVFAFLQQMDISVLSSLSEGMPNTLLESMSAGLPVVATAVGGSAEVVKHGETGYLVPAKDAQGLADALLSLIEDTSTRQYMAQKALERFTALFSAEIMTDRYEDIIHYAILKKQKYKLYNTWRRDYFISSLWQYWKCLVASILYYGKIIALFRLLKRRYSGGTVSILCLHDIVEAHSEWLIFDVSLFSEHFSKIIDIISKSYRFVSLEKACSLLCEGNGLKEDIVTITFDDCYNSFNGPVFDKCIKDDIPYTIFLNNYPLDKHEFLLYDLLIYLATSTWRRTVVVPFLDDEVFLLDNNASLQYFVQTVFGKLQVEPFVVWKNVIQDMADNLDVDLEHKNLSDHFLSWDDVRNLHNAGVTIGGHTVTHPLLTTISEAECYDEINKNKQRLEEKLNCSIKYFAYPYGHKNSYNEQVIKIVETIGFQNAFTLGRRKKITSPFTIGRRNISSGQFLDGKGAFRAPLFELELCGLADIVFGRRLPWSAGK